MKYLKVTFLLSSCPCSSYIVKNHALFNSHSIADQMPFRQAGVQPQLHRKVEGLFR